MSDLIKIGRRKRANDVRLNAIQEKARKTEAQQLYIKNALKGLDGTTDKSKHIRFSDSEDSCQDGDDDHHIKVEVARKPNADDILGFGDESDEEGDTIAVKPQFQGRVGEKLLELQSSYGNDARFRLDERFAEEESNDVPEVAEQGNDLEKNEVKDELARNMQVLSQVIGRDVSTNEQTKKAERFIDVSSRRYDPAKDDHLEVKVTREEKKVAKKKKKDKIEVVETDPKRFYKTSLEALKEAFASKSDVAKIGLSTEDNSQPFSFLAMLGRATDDEIDISKNQMPEGKTEQQSSDSRFAMASSTRKDIPTLEQIFRYDSSDTEEEEDNDGDAAGVRGKTHLDSKEEERSESRPQGPPKKNWPTTFFMQSPRDPRIVEGARDFCWNKEFEQIQREWLEVKDTLIKDYKKKHRDAKRKERRDKYEAKQLAMKNI